MRVTITEENSFTEPELIENREFTLSIIGTYIGVVTVQRIKSSTLPLPTDAWRDIKSYSSAVTAEENGNGVGSYYYRIGIKTGDFTSGTVVCEITT